MIFRCWVVRDAITLGGGSCALRRGVDFGWGVLRAATARRGILVQGQRIARRKAEIPKGFLVGKADCHGSNQRFEARHLVVAPPILLYTARFRRFPARRPRSLTTPKCLRGRNPFRISGREATATAQIRDLRRGTWGYGTVRTRCGLTLRAWNRNKSSAPHDSLHRVRWGLTRSGLCSAMEGLGLRRLCPDPAGRCPAPAKEP